MKIGNDKKKQVSINQGFTLIELLVVISIISLLSVIVLASVNDARDKAKNTKLNEIALQYINAFALLTNENASYKTSTSLICLGDENSCHPSFTVPIDSDLNDDLREYYPDMPQNEDFKVSNWSGVMYMNIGGSNPQLFWYLSGKNQKCVRGATANLFSSINTRCQYLFK